MDDSALAKLRIFLGMDEEERRELLDLTHLVEFEAGEKIITQGRLVQNLWFVLEGTCEVTRRTDSDCILKLAELQPTTVIGEMSFFHAAPHSADVIAQTKMRLLRLGREDFDRWAFEQHPVAFKLMFNSLEQLSERLRLTDQWITELVCKENHQPTPSEWTSFREILFRG